MFSLKNPESTCRWPMNIPSLKNTGQDIARMLSDYTNGPKREMLIDPALYAYLRGSGRKVERQFHAHLPGAKRPPRIDFRIRGTNPVLIEFAVRPAIGGSQLYGSQNKTELWKLCRFSNTQAKLRALLLIDLYEDSISKEALKKTYNEIHAGRGRFERNPVQIIYAHASKAYSFRWNPYKG